METENMVDEVLTHCPRTRSLNRRRDIYSNAGKGVLLSVIVWGWLALDAGYTAWQLGEKSRKARIHVLTSRAANDHTHRECVVYTCPAGNLYRKARSQELNRCQSASNW